MRILHAKASVMSKQAGRNKRSLLQLNGVVLHHTRGIFSSNLWFRVVERVNVDRLHKPFTLCASHGDVSPPIL